jgi:hypothetical protein
MAHVRGKAALAAAVALLAMPGAATATTAVPPCFAAEFSPAFAHDHTAFCLTNSDATGLRLYRSQDAGRHWDGGRLVAGRLVNLPDLVLSPAFPADPTVFVVSGGDGMWVSRDGGRTFATAPRGPYFGALRAAPYVEAVPTPHAAFAEGSLALVGTGVFDAVLGARTVVGAPTATTHFIVPPDYATTRQAVAIGNDVTPGVSGTPLTGDRMRAFRCEGDFTCATPIFDFGDVEQVHVQRIAPGDDVVVTMPLHPAGGVTPLMPVLHAWRSRDYGRTWVRWAGIESLLHRSANPGLQDIFLTRSADAPHRLFAQTNHYGVTGKTRPANQLWRSDDDGRTWTRVGYSFGPDQPHAGQGTLPWNDPGQSIAQTRAWISAQPGGLLYALGARVVAGRTTGQHLWCSRDLGRTWAVAC